MITQRLAARPILRIPVMGHKFLNVAERCPRLYEAMQSAPQRILFAFDIDNTLLRTDKTQPQVTTTFSNRPILFETVRHLRRGSGIALITGNDIIEQRPRTVDTIINYFGGTQETSLLYNLFLFGMKGGNRISFLADGQENKDDDAVYNQQNRIPEDDLRLLTQAAGEGINSVGLSFNNLNDINRPSVNPVQLALKPIKGDIRTRVYQAIISNLSPELRAAYNVMPAGGSTIDFDQVRINKGTTLQFLMGLNRWDLVVFMGDELKLTSDYYGKPMWGNDLSVVTVADLIAFAVNIDQSTVVDHCRVIPAGSGPLASHTLMQYFSVISETYANLPRGTRIELPPCRVPVLETKEIEIPDVIQNTDFNTAAVFLRINTLMSDPVTGKYLEEKGHPANESSVLTAMVNHLMKNIKIGLGSGDSLKRQLEVVKQIYNMLEDKSMIENLTLYTSKGSVKTKLKSEDGKLVDFPDIEFSGQRRINEADTGALNEIIGMAMTEYRSQLKKLVDKKVPEAKGYYDEARDENMVELRDDFAQISLVALMPSLREQVLTRIQNLLVQNGLSSSYVAESGGSRSVNINSVNAGFRQATQDYITTNNLVSLIYLGAEFFHKVSEQSGKIISGGDMDVLKLPQIIPIGLNPNQDEIRALKEPRVIAGGSGADAAYVWLSFITDNLEDRRILRR